MTFCVTASKTFPDDPDYSPAYIDTFDTREEAEKALAFVSDYPYHVLEEDEELMGDPDEHDPD